MGNDLLSAYDANREDYPVPDVLATHMHCVSAFLFGSWYSIILASAMSAGVKYLHPETPAAHGILQSIAWAIGSGIAIAIASQLSRTHRLAVGVGSTMVSASVWSIFLYVLRNHLDEAIGEHFFGYDVSAKTYLIGFVLLILIVGFVSAFLGAVSSQEEEFTAQLLSIPAYHWLWLWIAAFGWVCTFPIVAYYIWLQFATALYSIIHPSLWFQVGSGLFFGVLGIAVLIKGIEVSLRAVSDKSSYGGVVWKRVLMFLVGTVIFSSFVAPMLLNLDINRMKDMPASLGSHPWWLL